MIPSRTLPCLARRFSLLPSFEAHTPTYHHSQLPRHVRLLSNTPNYNPTTPRPRPSARKKPTQKKSSPSKAPSSVQDIELTQHATPEKHALSAWGAPHIANQNPPEQPNLTSSTQAALSTALAESPSSGLLAPVRIPNDPTGVLEPGHPAYNLLNNSSLVVQRQIEMMNVFLGFEQANRYVIMNGHGETIGYLAERDHGLGSTMARQAFKTHRSFTAHVFDAQGLEVLRIHRPFAWVNSYLRIYDPISRDTHRVTASSPTTNTAMVEASPEATRSVSPLPLSDMRIIGETQQKWAPLRRKYDLFTYRAPGDSADITSGDSTDTEIEAGMSQFASVDEPFLSWDFTLRDAQSSTIGSVNRSFGGLAREVFTDTGAYALRMDSAAFAENALPPPSSRAGAPGVDVTGSDTDIATRDTATQTALTLDQRAVMLASAVSIDFDYFSRHSGSGGGMGFMPLWFPWGGTAAEAGAGAGAGVGAAGAGEAGVLGAAGAAGELGAFEGATAAAAGGAAAAGAGRVWDSASPTASQVPEQSSYEQWASQYDSEEQQSRATDRQQRTGTDPGDPLHPGHHSGQHPGDYPGATSNEFPADGGSGDGGSSEGGGGVIDFLSDFFDP